MSFYIMITYEITLSKQFRKDYAVARHTVLFSKIDELVALVSRNPFQTPPPYEKLKGRSTPIRGVSINSIVWYTRWTAMKLRFCVAGGIMSKG